MADRTFYIWGEAGSGRTHLLQALVHEAQPGHARFAGPQSSLAAFAFDPRVALYAIDDCDSLSGAQQIAAVQPVQRSARASHQRARRGGQCRADRRSTVREDLRTRLGWGLVFHLAPLPDEGKAAVLKHAARERGIALADDVPAYLLTHFRRDMPSLMALARRARPLLARTEARGHPAALRTMLASPDADERRTATSATSPAITRVSAAASSKIGPHG